MEINPLSANAESTTDDKVVTSDSCWTQCRFRENVNFDKSDFKFASFGSKVMGKKQINFPKCRKKGEKKFQKKI